MLLRLHYALYVRVAVKQTNYFLSFHTIPTPQPTVKQVAWDRMNSLYSSYAHRFQAGRDRLLSIDVCMAWRHGICPMTFSVSPTPIVAVYGRRHPRS